MLQIARPRRNMLHEPGGQSFRSPSREVPARTWWLTGSFRSWNPGRSKETRLVASRKIFKRKYFSHLKY